MPNLKKEGLKLNYHTETNIDQRIRLEYVNPTLKTLTLKKNSKIALFMTLNKGNEIFKKQLEEKNKQLIVVISTLASYLLIPFKILNQPINQSINQSINQF